MGYNLFSGLQVYFIGLRTVKKYPELKKWMIIPFIIDLFLFFLLLYFTFNFLPAVTTYFVGWIEGAITSLFQAAALDWLFDISYFIFLILFGIVSIIAAIYAAYILSLIIASPFNSLLAEKTLQLTGALPEEPFKIGRWLSFTIKMFIVALLKAVVFLIVGLFAFIIAFIPGLNILSIYITLYMMSLDLFDYSLEAAGYNLTQRLGFGRKEVPMISGVSLALFATTLIPGLFFVLAPLGVVGASRIHAEKMLLKGSSE
ncbi:MAG: EI24 domain-containing protein [Bdellovibrionales bacterium]|nr:EI24 domain-containing protein [Bdellovibrionales bacterium]